MRPSPAGNGPTVGPARSGPGAKSWGARWAEGSSTERVEKRAFTFNSGGLSEMELIKLLKQLLDLFFAYQKDTRNGIPIWKDSGFIASTTALAGALVEMGTGVQMPVDLPVLIGAYLAANL